MSLLWLLQEEVATPDTRFLSHFGIFNVSFPSDESLQRIYNSILTSHLENFGEALVGSAGKFSEMTLKLYKELVTQLPPTPSKFHYVFNLRDFTAPTRDCCRVLLKSSRVLRALCACGETSVCESSTTD